MSTLFGSSKANLESSGDIEGSFDEDETKMTVGIDSKIGIRFEHMIKRAAVNIEAGYKGASYLNSLHEGSTDLVTHGVTGNLNFSGNYFDLGPYITLGVDFM
ncbi:MAG: Lpg1974 family pore-forming outer membrane protein [Gammaproteobacteria bacterium]